MVIPCYLDCFLTKERIRKNIRKEICQKDFLALLSTDWPVGERCIRERLFQTCTFCGPKLFALEDLIPVGLRFLRFGGGS